MKPDRDTLLYLIGALHGGPKDNTTYFFKLLRARTSSVGIVNYLFCEYPYFSSINRSVMQELPLIALTIQAHLSKTALVNQC
jgi:hypothetical protein